MTIGEKNDLKLIEIDLNYLFLTAVKICGTNTMLVPTQCWYEYNVGTNTMLVLIQCWYQHNAMLVPTFVLPLSRGIAEHYS